MAPDKAKAGREAHKVSKYSAHARDEGCSFTPFILDCYGSLGPAALQLLKDIRANSLGMVGKPSPFCLSRSAFFSELSPIWQHDNAKIVVQWMTLQRDRPQAPSFRISSALRPQRQLYLLLTLEDGS